MNKKFLIIAMLAFVFAGTSANICQAEPDFSRPMPEEHSFDHHRHPHGDKMKGHRPPSREDFEQRLNLTDEQKQIAKAQREKSIEKIKPILEEINNKKSEIEMTKMSRMAQQAIDEKVAELQGEIRALRKQAHEIRKENMKAFEASLSEAQRKELQKMKEEGRKRFEEQHKKPIAQ
ncbi:MAG: Spy/CpxP family protein refolding chaperone [Fusobacterium sp.]|nr:Spy/CpxP family protein refolding chaperone [Fusobacterium sp.]